MEGIANSLAKPTQLRRDGKPRPRSEAKRSRIVEVAIRHFAERGYSAARVEDIAAVDDNGPAHQRSHGLEIDASEFLPLRDDDESIGAA